MKKNEERIIWIVEDDPFYASWLGRKLNTSLGYKIRVFPDGETMLAECGEWPDLMLLDFNLRSSENRMSGLDVLRRLRDFHPELPVVVVSGQKDIDTAVELMRSGAWEYLIKDNESTADRIVDTVRDLIDLVHSEHQIRWLEKRRKRAKVQIAATVAFIAALVAAAFMW